MEAILSFLTTINFESLLVILKELYHDIYSLVDVFKGSSTAFITKGSGS